MAFGQPIKYWREEGGGLRMRLHYQHSLVMSVFIPYFQNSLPVTQNPYSLYTQRAIKAWYTSGASKLLRSSLNEVILKFLEGSFN